MTQVTVSAAVPVGAAAVAAPAPEMAPPAQAPPTAAPPAPPVAEKPKPEASSDAGSASDDPRLAALTAKSRDARKALGIDVDAEDSTAPEPQTDEESDSSEDEVTDQDTADTTPAEVETDLEPSLPPMPDGYYPADNRIADLLASVKQS